MRVGSAPGPPSEGTRLDDVVARGSQPEEASRIGLCPDPRESDRRADVERETADLVFFSLSPSPSKVKLAVRPDFVTCVMRLFASHTRLRPLPESRLPFGS